ncbi:IclR family transcriptional regulator [Ruania zhangjianzhongii]|uniref:IclR family transcriptional regulator n=1 Tax=Ruania zhangjianzhongii TaxID=2603206 RepID=UPI0011C81333|nr:IclR family transcriptional regulator [Ruania zhangjianzhongii]
MMQSLQRGFGVLELLVQHSDPITLGDLSRAAGLPAASTYRIVQSLIELGYAKKVAGGRYQHGSKVLELAGKVLTSMDYAVHSRPALLQLQAHTDETIHFGILAGDCAQYVDKLESRAAYRLASVVGMQVDLHCTATGKSILAFLPDGVRDRHIDATRLVAKTPKTITSTEGLLFELARIRANGYCLDDEEDREGIRCVGAPVFDHRGHAIGGISVSGPVFYFSLADATALAPQVIHAARDVSLSLGAPAASLPEALRA